MPPLSLPSTSKSHLGSSSFVEVSSTSSKSRVSDKRPVSQVEQDNKNLNSKPSGSINKACLSTNNNNVPQKGAPSKPPRKKRQAPLPPTTTTQLPPSASVSTSLPQEPLAVHSRSSSHSSGFESAGSPRLGSSPRHPPVATETVVHVESHGNSLRAAQKAQDLASTSLSGAKPKVSKKKRLAPQPPGGKY